MAVNQSVYFTIREELAAAGALLVAVSKTKPVEDIQELYELGQRDFGENYVQELVEKAAKLPGNIRWHFIGHLQTNKVKLIAPFVQLVHGVDSLKLLKEIDKQAAKLDKKIDCLLQVHIAQEETKFGFSEEELESLKEEYTRLKNVSLRGFMGMASFSDDESLVASEFKKMKSLFDHYKTVFKDQPFDTLSMGMSGDYRLAIEQGSTMVRIGSLLFGSRN